MTLNLVLCPSDEPDGLASDCEDSLGLTINLPLLKLVSLGGCRKIVSDIC